MPNMNEHAYHDDLLRVSQSINGRNINSPAQETAAVTETVTETTVSHIGFNNHMEAPVAGALEQSRRLGRTAVVNPQPVEEPVSATV